MEGHISRTSDTRTHYLTDLSMEKGTRADVPENVITELKEDEHKEPSVTVKVKSYFNIFESGRNLLDQFDVTYQWAFMESPVREGYYISPA